MFKLNWTAKIPEGKDDIGPLGDTAKKQWEDRQLGALPAHLDRCGAPKFVQKFYETFKPNETPSVLATRRFASDHKAQFLILSGGPGTGKTVAACEVFRLCQMQIPIFDDLGAMLETWQWDSRKGSFFDASDLARTRRWADGGERRWSRAESVRWLVLDDLGEERMDKEGFWLEDLQQLIKQRHADQSLKTVITTNLDLKGLGARYGDRVVDRVLENGGIATCGNESLRR